MPNLVDLTGVRFGRFLVAGRGPAHPRRTFWKCRCDCGNIRNVEAESLRGGRSRSCGCLKRELIVERGCVRRELVTKKKCFKCKKSKHIDSFHFNASRHDGRQHVCKTCQKGSLVAYYNGDPVRRRRKLLRRFGLTPTDYDEILVHQRGVCAICKHAPVGKHLAVDHDHATKKVRGLLCAACNRGLGWFKDDAHALQSALDYLKSWPAASVLKAVVTDSS
jgi:hypothetical protein